MENGWILIHRKIREKGYWKKSQYVHLWLHLLLSANHRPAEFLWNGEMIEVKKGQFITGRKELSEQTGIPQSTIEDILWSYERQHQIRQQKTTKYRLITILNWGSYQNPTAKATTKQQQADTNKELKELKEEIPAKAGAPLKKKMDIDYETGEVIPEHPKSHKRDDCIKLAQRFDELASKYAHIQITTPKSYFIVLNAVTTHRLTYDGILKIYEEWFINEKTKPENKVKLTWCLGKDNINSFKMKHR